MSDGAREQDAAAEGAAPRRGIGRRDLFTAAGAAAIAGIAGWGIGAAGEPGALEPAASATPTPAASGLPAVGLPDADRVAGITRPAVPQRHLLVTVLTVAGDAVAAADSIRSAPAEVPDDAGEATVTIGFSAEIAAAQWPERATGDMALPAFRNDAPGVVTGGDVVLQVCAETAAAVRAVTADAIGRMPQARVLWQQAGYRDAPTPHATARTSTGFIDGIANPRTPEELAEGVWIDGGRDTYVVYRRMHVDPAFLAQPREAQERAIGRDRDTGAPLSGGGATDNVDLFAKSPDGRVLIPQGAHARRAHPANIGRALMLRRSYSFDAAEGAGLVFAAFMNDPQTFVATQRRLDEHDDFIAHTRTDASGVFFVPA